MVVNFFLILIQITSTTTTTTTNNLQFKNAVYIFTEIIP